MSTNKTQNYQLNQWVKSDRVLMSEFNADNAKIDAALKAEANARTAGLAKKGNCTIGILTYTGDGQSGPEHPTRITFPRMPAFFIVVGGNIVMGRGGATAVINSFEYGSSAHTFTDPVSWSGNTLSMVIPGDANRQMNGRMTYTVVAFYAES